jgi:single-stranded DNA-binding protein
MSASAPAVNQVALVGNLTADPVLKQLDDDRMVCNLRVAVNDQKGQPMFIDVATFGAQADACAKYLTKAPSPSPAGSSTASGTTTAPAVAATTSSDASSSAASRTTSPPTATTRRTPTDQPTGAGGPRRRHHPSSTQPIRSPELQRTTT